MVYPGPRATGKMFLKVNDEYIPYNGITTVDHVDIEGQDIERRFPIIRSVGMTMSCTFKVDHPKSSLYFLFTVYGVKSKRKQRLIIRHMEWWRRYCKKTGKRPWDKNFLFCLCGHEVNKHISRPKMPKGGKRSA